jgi:hypothetical protein
MRLDCYFNGLCARLDPRFSLAPWGGWPLNFGSFDGAARQGSPICDWVRSRVVSGDQPLLIGDLYGPSVTRSQLLQIGSTMAGDFLTSAQSKARKRKQ